MVLIYTHLYTLFLLLIFLPTSLSLYSFDTRSINEKRRLREVWAQFISSRQHLQHLPELCFRGENSAPCWYHNNTAGSKTLPSVVLFFWLSFVVFHTGPDVQLLSVSLLWSSGVWWGDHGRLDGRRLQPELHLSILSNLFPSSAPRGVSRPARHTGVSYSKDYSIFGVNNNTIISFFKTEMYVCCPASTWRPAHQETVFTAPAHSPSLLALQRLKSAVLVNLLISWVSQNPLRTGRVLWRCPSLKLELQRCM